MAKKYFWFKMQEDFFRSKEIKKLRRIAGGDTFTIIYQKLIIMSLRDEGKIFFDGVEDSFAEEIAYTIDEDLDNVKLTLQFLKNHNLLDEMSSNEFVLPEAVRNIGTKDESAERVQRHRERKKQLLLESVTCNLQVTQRREREDLELEREGKRESERENNEDEDDNDLPW
jgi:predicted phage replisome organizer